MNASRCFLFLAFAASLAACAGKSSNVGVGSGNNYSTTPCVDNCGNDAQCQASCQDVGNGQPLPSGVQPVK